MVVIKNGADGNLNEGNLHVRERDVNALEKRLYVVQRIMEMLSSGLWFTMRRVLILTVANCTEVRS